MTTESLFTDCRCCCCQGTHSSVENKKNSQLPSFEIIKSKTFQNHHNSFFVINSDSMFEPVAAV